MRDSYETQQKRMRDANEAQQEEMSQAHNSVIVALQKQHEDEQRSLQKQHEEEHRSLRERVESLKEALVKGDRFKAISDRELARRFQDLTSDVDALARFRWDNGRVRTWPFPDKVFLNSENQRRDKQYLFQNTIWVILHEKIFCTPFRVLGNEGTSLEQQWMANFGQGELLVYVCLAEHD
jgi:anti-sigma28 factor (negative regulator of flagellin synthesis)